MSHSLLEKYEHVSSTYVVETWAASIVRAVRPSTMTPPPRTYNLVKAVEHVCRSGIGGDLVECGVWRGGSLMAMALALRHCGDQQRRLWGFDTFTGMTSAGPRDQLMGGMHFDEIMRTGTPSQRELYQARAPLDLVQRNMASTRFPADRLSLVVGDELNVVADQIGCPTYAADLAEALLELARQRVADGQKQPGGVYHLAGSGETSWHNFAQAIFAGAARRGFKVPVRVNAIPTSGYPTPAVRPANSRLDCSLIEKTYGVRLPTWPDALERCLDAIALHKPG